MDVREYVSTGVKRNVAPWCAHDALSSSARHLPTSNTIGRVVLSMEAAAVLMVLVLRLMHKKCCPLQVCAVWMVVQSSALVMFGQLGTLCCSQKPYVERVVDQHHMYRAYVYRCQWWWCLMYQYHVSRLLTMHAGDAAYLGVVPVKNALGVRVIQEEGVAWFDYAIKPRRLIVVHDIRGVFDGELRK